MTKIITKQDYEDAIWLYDSWEVIGETVIVGDNGRSIPAYMLEN